jgi:VWFA-related protein
MEHMRVFSPEVALLLALACLSPAQEPRPHDSDVTIRSSVQEVVLDLLVRDSHGRQLKNLRPDELEIYEDGVRQEIRSFRFLPGREVLKQQASTETQAQSHKEVTPGRPASPLPAVNLICIVFQNLDPNTRKFAVEAAQEFLRTELPPATWVGVFNLSSQLTALHPFTTNRAELMEAATKAFTTTTVDFVTVADTLLSYAPTMTTVEVNMIGNPASGGTVVAGVKVSGGELNQQAIVGAEISNGPAASLLRGERARERRQFGTLEGMRQTDQILSMIAQLGQLPGHKTVLLFSPGLATTGDPDRFQSILNKANRANMSIYSIDINGLTQNSNVIAGNAALKYAAALSSSQARARDTAGAMSEKMKQGDYVNDAVRTTDTQASLRALSEGTGGFLIGSTNDLRKPFVRVLEDLDTHYEVIYRPASEKYDGHFRNIVVKPARAGLTVQSRSGYFALPALKDSPSLAPHEVAALSALSAKPQPHAFDFRSAVVQFRPGPANSQHAVAFELPAASLAATPEPDSKKHRVHVSMLALVKDANGQVVDKVSQDAPYEIADENLPALRASTITFTRPVDLPPGHYTIEAAVVDRESKRASTGSFQFDSPERKGVGLSSIMLVQRYEPVGGPADPTDPFQIVAKPQSRRVIPELLTNLSADARPSVYFVVYPDPSNAAKPKIRIEFMVGGQVLANQTADLPAPDAAGAIPMIVRAATHPGKCELRITAVQGAQSQARSLTYTIAQN